MNIKDIMHNVTKVSGSTSISEAARIMDSKEIGSVLVEEDEKVIGMVTERDILRKVVAKGRNPEQTTVKDVMNSPLITIDGNVSLEEASEIMAKNKIRRVVVTDASGIVGIVTTRSISDNVKYMFSRVLKGYDTDAYKPSYGKE